MNEKSFNLLNQLIHFINGNKIKQLFFPLARGGKSLQHRLYRGILSTEIKNPEDIGQRLFPGARDKTASANRLQFQLQDSLLDVLFLIDANESGFTPLQKAYYQCYRNMTAVKILLGKTERAAAIPIAERTIQKAIKYELVGIVVELARDLRNHYGGISGQRSKWKIYNRLVEEWTEKYLIESKVEGYYSDIMANFILSKSSKKEFAILVDEYLSKVESNVIAIGSFRARLFFHQLKALRYEIVNDFSNMLKVSEKALMFFNAKKELVSLSIWYAFNQNLLIANIRLRRLQTAEVVAQKCVQLSVPGTYSWYNANYLYIILCFHSNQLKKAVVLWQKAFKNQGFNQMPETQKEAWLIIEAAIHFFLLSGKVSMQTGREQAGSFRVKKFLNEVPSFSKDKRGNNINILILHILFLVQGQRYHEIHDRVESLRVYASRYLRKDDMFRSNCFIRMLICLPAGHFHREAVIRKAKPFLEKLRTVPYEKADQPIEVEMAPYETLWEIVLELLDKKPR